MKRIYFLLIALTIIASTSCKKHEPVPQSITYEFSPQGTPTGDYHLRYKAELGTYGDKECYVSSAFTYTYTTEKFFPAYIKCMQHEDEPATLKILVDGTVVASCTFPSQEVLEYDVSVKHE